MSSSLHSRALGKALVFERIACPMRFAPTPLGFVRNSFKDGDGDRFTPKYW